MPNNIAYKPQRSSAEWYKISNSAKNEPIKIYIYDFIGRDFWGEGVTAENFVKDIDNISGDIDLHVNSPGGDVYDAIAIHTALTGYDRGTITNYVDAIAASSASWIIMNGGRIIMPRAAQIMIHNPWIMLAGESIDLRKAADQLDATKESIINMYVGRSGKSRDEISAKMDETTFFSASDAVDFGFADEVSPDLKMAACCFDLKCFNLSSDFLKIQESLHKRLIENSLRDAGSSRGAAKKAVSNQTRDARHIDNWQESAMEKATIQLAKEIEKCLK